MPSLRHPAALLAALLLATPAQAQVSTAYEVVRQEQTCPRDRESRSLRQTVVILDEAMVEAKPEANQVWKRIVVEAADVREVATGVLGRRERLTVLVARRDGSELVPLFLGCSPNLPTDEVERARADDSAWDRFVGGDSGAVLKKRRDDFAGGIARALAQVSKRAEAIGAAPAPPGALLRALQNAGRLADPNFGLPRFLLVSPFHVLDKAVPATVPGARTEGFTLAERSGIDFGRAEVYLAGAALGEGATLEFARALILGSKGVLVAARSDGLPRLQGEPASLRIYAGFIDYLDQRLPLQLRVAASPQGDLVDSWIEMTAQNKSAATPLGGKMLCRGDTCEVRGDGRFAQVWYPDPQSQPTDRTKIPFGGARMIEMTLKNDGASGRVFDPNIVFKGDNGARRQDLRFEIQRVEGGQF